jgi:hypothetical protein
MSRLINYGPGEICDRLTILSLKILYGSEAGREVTHFQTEQTALLQQVRSRTLNGVWFEQVLQLAAVNAALWRAEDALRSARKQHAEIVANPKQLQELVDIVLVAFGIQDLNDKRAQLVQQINRESGEATGQEKL